MAEYNFKEIEAKWQKYWLDKKTFATPEEAPKQKMYVLDMFPYPSGDGLHVGHAKIYTGSDIIARYLRMKGFNVLHPTGWDAFGLPTENSAIKKKVPPAQLTAANVKRFREQMQRLGLSYDWDREVNTTDPSYYKWTQWIFLQLYKMGLAYEATVPINWCPKDKTGLANEEVVDGKCERCGTPVEQRPVRQWMLRITKYADQLLQGLGGVDWPAYVKELQENWIGKSNGVEVTFKLDRPSAVAPVATTQANLEINVYTTRIDTIYGVTYVVVAPEHPLVEIITTPEQQTAVKQYQAQAAQQTDRERSQTDRDKTGVFTGGFALHPLTGKPLPIWIADYVLLSYGTGAVMGVPAHDERDFVFATKYSLPIVEVISPPTVQNEVKLPYTGDGVLINSQQYDGQSVEQAQIQLTSAFQQRALGKKKSHYKLRDWVFSRQRYWGEPIPLIHCDKCGVVPVREEDLPVKLPELANYEPTGTGESPLAAVTDWVTVKCPTCANMGRRETNTMPQWAGSSWYFLRFVDPHNDQEFASKEAMRRWLPVDVYIGGVEHAVLHLLYARFWVKALHDAGLLPYDEPFSRFRSVGLIMGEDGQKMSKSRGNVINPDDIIAQYGADTLRLYEMFIGPFDAAAPWNTSSIAGVHRFLKRTWSVVQRLATTTPPAQLDPVIERQLQLTIKRVSEGTEQLKFNTSIAALMELLNTLEAQTAVDREVLKRFVLLLSPYAPHIAEELWESLGHAESISSHVWPEFNEAATQTTTRHIPVQVNGRVRGTIEVAAGATQADVEAAAKALPNVAQNLNKITVQRVVYLPDKLINFVG